MHYSIITNAVDDLTKFHMLCVFSFLDNLLLLPHQRIPMIYILRQEISFLQEFSTQDCVPPSTKNTTINLDHLKQRPHGFFRTAVAQAASPNIATPVTL